MQPIYANNYCMDLWFALCIVCFECKALKSLLLLDELIPLAELTLASANPF